MALFQPSNIIPSTFTTGAVDVEKDTVKISWQVNGNSAMTAFKIDILDNSSTSSAVATTGKLGVTTTEQAQFSLPFYGTNRFGAVQMFTYSLGSKWKEKWSGLANGKEYKIKITQYWNENGTEKSLAQIASEVFKTASTPTITIQQTDKDYKNAVTLSNTLATSIGYFHADYTQAQGDGVRFVQWQVANARDGKVLDILADTGDINTPTLDYEFNGFFNGQQYAIRCIVESESGQQASVTNTNTNGWVFFDISITGNNSYDGEFTAQHLCKENATLLEWEGVEVITPTVTGTGVIRNGSLVLDPNASVSWAKKKGDGTIPFISPLAAVVKCSYEESIATTQQNISGPAISFERKSESQTRTTSAVYETMSRYKYTFVFAPPTGWKIIDITVMFVRKKGSGLGNRDEDLTEVITKSNSDGTVTVTGYSRQSGTGECIAECEFERYAYSQYIPLTGEFVSAIVSSTNAIAYNVVVENQELRVFLYTVSKNSNLYATVSIKQASYAIPKNTLLSIGEYGLMSTDTNRLQLQKNGATMLAEHRLSTTAKNFLAIISPSTLYVLENHYTTNTIEESNYNFTPAITENIPSVTVFGGTNGATFDSVAVYQGDGGNVVSLYRNNLDFKPVWNNPDYSLYMAANFNGNLQGGTGNADGNGFQIYRQELGKNELTPIANVSSLVTSLKDYGIVSNKSYQYTLCVYDSNNAFMGEILAKCAVHSDEVATIVTRFQNYSLMVCDYDYDKDEYHVRKQYLFKCNLSVGAISNNNAPTLNKNFTRCPTRMGDTANYASGTLSGLIGAIYTVPALIEQIGAYKRTIKPSTLDYFDSVDLERELNALSTAPYQLFLRDKKGHLYMVATSGAITMATDIKKGQQPITMSLPWVEIGDASNVTIIQTPEDYGWNNDNQLLATSLDVDVETGDLTATYPYPYNGTTFRLTGVQSEVLTAETPIGVTPAQFSLSDTATQPTDGELNATVLINSEDK